MENTWFCPLCNSDFTHHQFFDRVASRYWNGQTQIPIQVTYAICDTCGLVFLWDRHSDAENDEYYRMGNYRLGVQGTPQVTKRVLEEQTRRANFLLPEIDIESVKKLLDVGASTGLLMKALQEKYECEVLGIEPSEHFRIYSKLPMFSELALIYTDEYYNAFDLITCIHTLEHMNEPLRFLTALHEFIADDGHLILEVPNLLTEHAMTISHPIIFTTDTLTTALNRSGWEIVWMKEFYSFKRDRTLPANILVKAKPGRVVEAIQTPDMDALKETYTANLEILRKDREKFDEEVKAKGKG